MMKKLLLLVLILYVVIGINAQATNNSNPDAMKATTGTGLHKNRIYWLRWDLNNDNNPGDDMFNGVTGTYTSPAGYIYHYTISNVTSSGTNPNAILVSQESDSWGGNNFPSGYGGFPFSDIISISQKNEATVSGDGTRANFRLTVTATDPYGNVGNATGLVLAGSESLGSSTEWYSISAPSGKIRYIDKYILGNNWANFSVQLQPSNAGKTMKVVNVAGGDSRGDVMLFAENVPYVDIEVKGGGGQHITLGFLEELDYGDAPSSYGSAYHLIENKFSGGIFSSNTNVNTASSTDDIANSTGQLAKVFDPVLRLGADIDAENSQVYAAAGANPNVDDATVDDEDALKTSTTNANGYLRVNYINKSAQISYMSVWIDKDRNGVFDGTEKLSHTISSNKSGDEIFDLTSLNLLVGSNYYTRIRYSSQNNLLPTGFAPDGEVEDHWINVVNNLYNILGTVYLDSNFGTPDGTPFYNVTVKLYNSSNVLIDTTTTDSNGNYLFPGLANGTYTVKIDLPSLVYKHVSSTDATPNDGSTTVAINNANVTNTNFGLYYTSQDFTCIGGNVYGTNSVAQGSVLALRGLYTINPTTGAATLRLNDLFGGGAAASSGNKNTSALALDPFNNIMYYVDRLISPTSYIYSYNLTNNTYGGTAISVPTTTSTTNINKAGFNPVDKKLYLHDANLNRIYVYSPSQPISASNPSYLGQFSFVDGAQSSVLADFNGGDITFDGSGNLVAAFYNNSSSTGRVVVFPGRYDANSNYLGVDIANGKVLTNSNLSLISSVAFISNGNILAGFDSASNPLRTINPITGVATVVSATLPFALSDLTSCAFPNPDLSTSTKVANYSCSAGTLTYTIEVKNTGNFLTNNTKVFDELPNGLTLSSATLNGIAISNIDNEILENGISVNSPGAVSGVVDAGNTATLVLNCTIAAPTENAVYNNQAFITYDGSTLFNIGGKIPTDDPSTVSTDDFTSITYDIPNITGTSTLNVGATTQLLGSGTSASSNPWTSSNTAVATVSSVGLITAISAGTSTITYTNNKGCSKSLIITVVFIDTDGDGVSDVLDLDNDNDGILDTNEWRTCSAFLTTGADQIATAPANAVGMVVKLWGAGGSHEIVNAGGHAGTGGYTMAKFGNNVVSPGTQFTVVVGQGGMQAQPRSDNPNPSAYGFGGISHHDQAGGLSGIFTGSATVIATSQSRALAIAGGGGGSDLATYTDYAGGTNGNSLNSGGYISNSMLGSPDNLCGGDGYLHPAVWFSSGGGGYTGGGRTNYEAVGSQFGSSTCTINDASGKGGSGYVSPLATYSSIQASADGSILPPNTSDPVYITNVGKAGTYGATAATQTQAYYQGGNGLVQICWILDTDNDGTPDYLDLDSDGDGCPDALEGGDNVAISMLDSNNRINVAANGTTTPLVVDAQGVPVVVNSGSSFNVDGQAQGQNAGTAYNNGIGYNACKCFKAGATGGTVLSTNHGVTVLGRAGDDGDGNTANDWPMVRKGAWTALEGKSKGFVINRVPTTAQVNAITNAVEGMMVYDEEADCLKIYTKDDAPATTYSWRCFNNQTCPDVL